MRGCDERDGVGMGSAVVGDVGENAKNVPNEEAVVGEMIGDVGWMGGRTGEMIEGAECDGLCSE